MIGVGREVTRLRDVRPLNEGTGEGLTWSKGGRERERMREGKKERGRGERERMREKVKERGREGGKRRECDSARGKEGGRARH